MKVKKFHNYSLIKNSKDPNSKIELHYSALDWDDNILHMPTTILMDQKVGDKWIPTEVSTLEFAKVRNDKENWRLRNNDPKIAFSQFRDFGPRGNRAFIEDVKYSISKGDFAPSWDHFKEILIEGSIFAIITARGHEPETIKEAIEYIIDTCLTDDEQYILYNNCLKHSYIFSDNRVETYDRIPKGKIFKTELVQNWLDNCDYYGVSSAAFAKKFGEASAQNPERAKQLALDSFLERCNSFAKKIGAKSVSVGFSDDDPKNVEHISLFFKEKSALSNELGNSMKFNIYKTTDRGKKGGTRTKFVAGEEIKFESSHQAPGMESSILPFTKWNNMTSYHYPNTKDIPTDNSHHELKMKTAQALSLNKDFVFNIKDKVMKKLKNKRK